MSSIFLSQHIKPDPSLGFGEKIPGQSLASTTLQKVHSIAVLILIGMSILAAGALMGTVVAAPISIALGSAIILGWGAASGAGIGVLGLAGITAFGIKNRHRSAVDVSHIKEPQAPKLGAFTKNHILPTAHTKESSEWKLDMLRSAEQSIELSGNFCGGKLFREALDIMEKSLRTKPKLQIHLTASENLIEKEDRKKLEELRKTYPERFHFLETNVKLDVCPTLRSVENHVKLLVVDGKYFVAGGSGLQDEMGSFTGDDDEHLKDTSRPAWKGLILAHAYRDMDFVGEGAAAKTWRQEFYKLWHLWSDKMGYSDPHAGFKPLDESQPKGVCAKWETAIKSGDVVQNVDYMPLISDPEKPNAITSKHIDLIRSAKKTIRVANLTFNTCEDTHEALQKAVHDGVDVSLITNGERHKDHPKCHEFFARANYPRYLPLIMGRKITKKDTQESLKKEFEESSTVAKVARVYEYSRPKVMYHTKGVVIDEDSDDNATVIAGSYNFGIKSHGLSDRGGDYETGQVIKSKALAQKIAANLEKDIKNSTEVTFKDAYTLYQSNAGALQAKYLAPFLV